jgi:hypothetical protein
LRILIFFLFLNVHAAEKPWPSKLEERSRPKVQYTRHGNIETFTSNDIKVSRNLKTNYYTGSKDLHNFNGILIGRVILNEKQAKAEFEALEKTYDAKEIDWQKILK